MANYVGNISKGRAAAYWNNVDAETPSTSRIVVVPLSASGTEAEGKDFLNLSTFLGGAPNEQTEGSWVRKVLTAGLIGPPVWNNSTDRAEITTPAILWTAPTAGHNTTGLFFGYEPTTGATDAEIVFLWHLDFAVTADGNDVELKSGEVYRAT